MNEEPQDHETPRCPHCGCRVRAEGETCVSCREVDMGFGGWQRVHGGSFSDNCGHHRTNHLPDHGD